MGEIIDLMESKLKRIVKFAFKGWSSKFKEDFSHTTAIKDLKNETIKFFIVGTPQVVQLLQTLVGRAILTPDQLKLGFDGLDIETKKNMIDISVFLIDQFRFEAMFRLGWVEEFPARSIPIVELILDFYNHYEYLQYETPKLSPSHELYKEYIKTHELDRGGVVRRLIPQMLKVFEHLPVTNGKSFPES